MPVTRVVWMIASIMLQKVMAVGQTHATAASEVEPLYTHNIVSSLYVSEGEAQNTHN
jgi:hypothetical protein